MPPWTRSCPDSMAAVGALAQAAMVLVVIRQLALVALRFVHRIARAVFPAFLDQLLIVLGEEVALGAYQRVVVEGARERADIDRTAAPGLGGNVVPSA